MLSLFLLLSIVVLSQSQCDFDTYIYDPTDGSIRRGDTPHNTNTEKDLDFNLYNGKYPLLIRGLVMKSWNLKEIENRENNSMSWREHFKNFQVKVKDREREGEKEI